MFYNCYLEDRVKEDEVDILNGMATLSKIIFFRALEREMTFEEAEHFLKVHLKLSQADAHILLYKIATSGTTKHEGETMGHFLLREARKLCLEQLL